MPITLAKLIKDVQLIAASGPIPDDFRISDRLVEHWIAEVRSKLISQAIDKAKDISDTWIQTINCLELEQVDKAECCDIQTGCLILKSKLPIPNTIETKDNNLVLGVTGLDGTHITQTNRFKQRYKRYGRYTGQNKGWYIKDNYVYVINDDILTFVNVSGIFENPSDIGAYISCTGKPCFDYTSDYPVSYKMATDITDIIINTKVKPLMIFPQDIANDGENKGTNVIKE